MAFEAAPVGERDRDRCSPSRRALPPGSGTSRTRRHERADLRVGERGLVTGFGIARLAAERQRDAERDAVLRQHQIGGLQDVVALDHALCCR